MFDKAQLVRLLALHERSFGLFTWLNASLKGGRRSLARVADALAFSEAAVEWIRANRSSLPQDFRPAEEETDEFAHLFVSYLATSFEVVDRSAVRACPGCWCCVYWIDSKHLRARNPDSKARSQGRALKVLCLGRLAEECGLPLLDRELDAWIGANRDVDGELALVTYVSELVRRTHFASQGEGVLALWREIAWEPDGGLAPRSRPRGAARGGTAEGGPKKKFRLKPEAILAAEKVVKERLARSAT